MSVESLGWTCCTNSRETCTTAAQTHRVTSRICNTTCMTMTVVSPSQQVARRHRARQREFRRAALGKKLGHCARACVGGGVQSARFHSNTNSPTVGVLSVANARVRDAERARRKWACTLQQDTFGRPSRKQHGVIRLLLLCRLRSKPLRHPTRHGLTVPDLARSVGGSRHCALPWMARVHCSASSTSITTPGPLNARIQHATLDCVLRVALAAYCASTR